MKKTWLILPVLTFFMAAGFVPKPAPDAPAAENINWISIEEAEARAKQDGKKILVDVYTDWCGWCKRMDATTYSDPQVVDYINNNFHAVKFDAEQKEDVTVKGRTFKFVDQGRRGYHELAAGMLQGKLAYPATVFLNSDFDLLVNIPGYQKTDAMMAFLSYFKEELYNQQVSLQSYLDSYNKSR